VTETSGLSVDIIFSTEQWRELDDIEPVILNAAKAAHTAACKILDESGPHEVAINLSDDATITELNHNFLGKDKPTNVLSFPFEDDFPELAEGPKPLGDIILAIETIRREADEQDIELSHHVAHLVVHGILHLFGYDHLVEDEAEEMEGLEVNILATLDIPSPYRTA
jgi:probable rRNA maturation factor